MAIRDQNYGKWMMRNKKMNNRKKYMRNVFLKELNGSIGMQRPYPMRGIYFLKSI